MVRDTNLSIISKVWFVSTWQSLRLLVHIFSSILRTNDKKLSGMCSTTIFWPNVCKASMVIWIAWSSLFVFSSQPKSITAVSDEKSSSSFYFSTGISVNPTSCNSFPPARYRFDDVISSTNIFRSLMCVTNRIECL